MINFQNHLRGETLSIREVTVTNRDLDELLIFIEKNPQISNLELFNNDTNDQTNEKIATALAACKNLTTLHLGGNNIGPRGSAKLAESLAACKNLTSLNLSYNNIGPQGSAKLAESLAACKNLTNLNLTGNNMGPEGTSSLAKTLTAFKNLTSLNLNYNNIGPQGSAKLAESLAACKNLTSLDLSYNNIGPEGLNSLAKILATCKNLANLNLTDNNIGPKVVSSLAKTLATCKNLTTLYLGGNRIGNEGAIALANALVKFNKLLNLDLSYNKITIKGAIALSKINQNSKLDIGLNLQPIVDTLLPYYFSEKPTYPKNAVEIVKRELNKKVMVNNLYLRPNLEPLRPNPFGKQELSPETIKKIIFKLAPLDYTGEVVRYLLDRPKEESPFLINSKSPNGQRLINFYTHLPKTQQFLFSKGAIPQPSRQKHTLHNIAMGNQSTHDSEVVKRTNFFTKQLVQKYDASDSLEGKAVAFKDSIKELFSKDNAALKISLLDITEQEKKSVMEKTLDAKDPVPSDEDFVKAVMDKAQQVLEQRYLNARAWDSYYSAKLQYNWIPGDERYITIPQSIGLIANLAQITKPTQQQMLELTAALYEKQKLMSKKEAFNLLKDSTQDQISDHFKAASKGLDIIAMFQQQQEFKLAKQLYVAATTYGENSSACLQGTWTQIIATAEEITPDLQDKYVQHREEERAREAQKNNVTPENIVPLLESWTEEALKPGSIFLSIQGFIDALLDLAIDELDIENPEKITLSEQTVLSSLNTYFIDNVKKYLPNFTGQNGNLVPTLEEYKIIINNVWKVQEMQKFAENPEKYIKAQQQAAAPEKATSHVERLKQERARRPKFLELD